MKTEEDLQSQINELKQTKELNSIEEMRDVNSRIKSLLIRIETRENRVRAERDMLNQNLGVLEMEVDKICNVLSEYDQVYMSTSHLEAKQDNLYSGVKVTLVGSILTGIIALAATPAILPVTGLAVGLHVYLRQQIKTNKGILEHNQEVIDDAYKYGEGDLTLCREALEFRLEKVKAAKEAKENLTAQLCHLSHEQRELKFKSLDLEMDIRMSENANKLPQQEEKPTKTGEVLLYLVPKPIH